MVSIEQVQNGIANYIDAEIVAKMTGWQKWAVGTAAGVVLQRAPKLYEQARSHPLIQAMGVIDGEGMIDADTLHKELKVQAQSGPISVDIPKAGTVKFSEADVDKLFAMIKNA